MFQSVSLYSTLPLNQIILYLTGRPAPLSECRVLNLTDPSVKIGCREGFDGGLPQTFMLEVYENDQLKTKVRATTPTVSGDDVVTTSKFVLFFYRSPTSSPFSKSHLRVARRTHRSNFSFLLRMQKVPASLSLLKRPLERHENTQ